MRARLALVAPLFLLAGCADDPLIFASGTTVGIKVAVSPTESQPLKLSVGYDQLDATYIPTTMDKSRQRIASDRNQCASPNPEDCKVVVVSQEDVKPKIDDAAKSVDKLLTDNPNSSVRPQLESAQKNLNDLRSKLPDRASTVDNQQYYALKTDDLKNLNDALQAIQDVDPNKLAAGSKGDVNDAKDQTQSAVKVTEKAKENAPAAAASHDLQNDSLSVMSTFNLETSADGKSAKALLGKTFATGIAAQNISKGLEMSLPGSANKAAAAADCIKQYKAALGDATVTEAKLVAVCGG